MPIWHGETTIFKVNLSVILVGVALSSGALYGTKTYAEVQTPLPWQEKHQAAQQQRDRIFAQLNIARSALERKIHKENTSLLARLQPPAPRATGYQLLPSVKKNLPTLTVKPTQTLYSLKWLEDRFNEQQEKINQWLSQIPRAATVKAPGTDIEILEIQAPPDIEALVDDFEQFLKTLRTLENHLDYHSQWQSSIRRYPAFFHNKNKLVSLIREMNQLILDMEAPSNDTSEQITALRQQIMQRLAPFQASPGLRIINTPEGSKILPVTVCTDIEDTQFLQAFKRGVDEAFSQSDAAQAYQFSVALTWQRSNAWSLYKGKPLSQGTAVDPVAHRALFKDCPLVLTTGAASTHALVGSYIILGTDPTTGRTLAHEFGHFLGFSDAYVRGFDGQPGDPYGAILVEWTGMTDDLMGNSGAGRVSTEMIETLIKAYGRPSLL